jgi:2-dehydrotetronate isomerase
MSSTNIRLSANLGFLWSEHDLPDRIDQAAAAGFRAIELHWPYDTAPEIVQQRCKRHDLQLLSINTPLGDLAVGEAGLGAQPGRETAFRDTFVSTLQWAQSSGARMIHVLPGMAYVANEALSRSVFVSNLRWAAEMASQAGLILLLEALNPRDKPGYFYHTQAQAKSILDETGCANIKLMFDVYHVGVTEGDVLTKLEYYLPVIGHIQIAAVPSRHEPDEGEIRYEAVFKRLVQLGYNGWVGCEYKPRTTVREGLGWRQSMGFSVS